MFIFWGLYLTNGKILTCVRNFLYTQYKLYLKKYT